MAAGIVCPHKGQRSFQPQMWPRGLGHSCTRFPSPGLGLLTKPARQDSAGTEPRRRLWASVLRNWGMPSFALQWPPGLVRAEPAPEAPSPFSRLSTSHFQLSPDKPST